MPLYRVKCDHCQTESDVFRHFEEYNDLPECCGEPVHRVICPSMVSADIQPYQSQITGEMISSRSKHREHLRQHRCIEVGNETKHLIERVKPLQSPPGLKETLIRVANDKMRN